MNSRQKKTLARIIAAAVLLIAAVLLPLGGPWKLIAFLAPYLLVGGDVLWRSVVNISHGEVFDENFLMSIATVGAMFTAEYSEGVAVMLLYQIGELFQSVAVGKSRKSIAELMDIRPDHANVLRGGEIVSVTPDEVELGETLIIKPGERVPLDAVILEGSGSVDTAALTGESMPVDVAAGDEVMSGSINLTGLLRAQVKSVYAESTVSRILELAENAADRKAKTEDFITKFAKYYTPAVVLGAALLGVLPPLLLSEPWTKWIHRALIFLVVSCPCALVISVPLSFFGGIGGASKRGILVKGSNYLEALSKVKTVVFDKTGTLTRGTFTVSAVHPEGMESGTLMALAASAERFSTHPIARAVVQGVPECREPEEAEEVAGCGVRAVIGGLEVLAGNGRLMESRGVKFTPCREPGSVIYVAAGGKFAGSIVVTDEVKPDAREAVERLHAMGVSHIAMLTGDTVESAEAVGRKLGIDEILGKLLPAGKVEAVERLIHEREGALAFVGDGINDAPVLSRADVGIAMGALGSDAAIEAADVVLMDDAPSRVAEAIAISKRTVGIVWQNIIFALAVKAVILVLSAVGYAGMWLAVFADVGVAMLAILNAMRTIK